MMYTPLPFREDGATALREVLAAGGLCHFVTATEEGLVSSVLPLYLQPDEGEFGTLYGHLARANPQWRLPPQGEAMALFMGPDAYITPSWYETKKETGKVVPTWNYVTVQVHGAVEFFEESERLLEVVTRLTNHHEQTQACPWKVSDAPAEFIEAQLRGIIGIRLPISRIEAKKKMSQNRSAQDRENVAQGLGESACEKTRAAGKLVGDTLG